MKNYKLWFLLTLIIAAGCVFGQDEQLDDNIETEITDPTTIEPDYGAELIPETPSPDEVAQAIEDDVEVTKPLESETAVQNEKFVDFSNWDSLTSRYAPQRHSLRGGVPYVLTEARLRQIRSQFMYWFFDMGGNADNEGDYQRAIQSSTQTIHKNLNFQLPHFGFRFNYTRVSLNGYLEFSDPPENYGGYPLVFPVKDWPARADPAFIGIFLSKCRIGSIRAEEMDQRRPGVYFRMERDLQFRNDQFGVEVRERLMWDVREGMVGADSFVPKHAVIVTWKNITFAGGISQSLHNTNTFQIVLATDEVFTYCIFNYLDLQWTAHTEAGGDTLKGEGGVPAFVGFNAGNGTRSYEYAPYSQGPTLRDLTGRGWTNGFPGRHIFRIDENILTGNCNKDIDGANLPLVFAPESGNMLGGTVVNITGPCFDPSDKVICKFDIADEVFGIVVDSNRAICIQPRLYVEGYVRFEIAIGNEKFKWKGKYFVETPGTAAEKIFFVDNAVTDINPPEIRIKWVKQNLTTNDNSPIRISLWGYRETSIRPEFLYIDLLADGITNTGEYTISPAAYRNRDNRIVSDMQFGFIQINLTDPIQIPNADRTVTPLIWSRPIPLGWYFSPQWEREFGTRWPRAMCDQWIKRDRFLKNFAHELHQCPCTLNHALNDKGRFLPDFNCDKDSNPRCDYNRGSMHCVRSGSPTLEGSEQQCCYDKNDFLMLSYDQQWGSFPRRSHNLGFLPWNEANKVPTLSHWFHDIVPRYLCCIWQSEQAVGCETLRFERRPSQDCVSYQAPSIAGVFGDPHVITFDDLAYTFNGKGEFVLVRTKTNDNKLDIQGRFEQMPMNEYGEVRATQLTSIAARGNSSTVVEVRARPEEARWRYRLDVIVDGRRVYFDRPSLKFQHFPGVTVYTPTYILNQSEVIMMFDSGAGVEVIDNRGFMTARVFLPWNFINRTRGLFGNWSFDMTDDFITPDGSLTPITTNLNDFERIYTDFGMKWILEDREDPNVGGALFHREFGRTSATFNNRTFRPEFRTDLLVLIPENRSIHRDLAFQFCHENYHCQFDYAMTLSRHVAHFSQNYYSSIINMKHISEQRIISCGILPTPRFGRKSNFLFIPGTTVMFECDQNFVLVGDQRRECTARGQWDVPIFGYTECLRAQEYSARNAGITSAIVLALIIPLVLCIAYVAYKVYQRLTKKDTNNTWIYGPPSRSASRMKLDEVGNSSVSPTTRLSDDDFTYKSPINSEPSSADSTIKKRRSYDKSYRTHEPLEGLPEVNFEEKPWDLESSHLSSEYEPINTKSNDFPNRDSGPEYTEPFKSTSPIQRQASYSPDMRIGEQKLPLRNSNPNLLESPEISPEFSPEYSVIDKNKKERDRDLEKQRLQSQSSVITQV